MAEENVKVAVRVRPFNQRELDAKSKLVVAMNGNQTVLTNPKTNEEKKFAFDFSYWSHDGFKSESNGYMSPSNPKYADQKKVFSDLGAGVLQNAWNGYNATLFAYGQTGSGKSYSVVGYGQNKGIVPLVCEEIFNKSETAKTKGSTIEVTFSMLEIYSEICRDLLSNKADRKSGLTVREDPKNGFYAQGLQKTLVANYNDINSLMDEGNANRTIAATNMNATSSRAHTIVTVNLVQKYKNEAGKEMAKSSIINLVDLAGSERADQTGATGDRLKEGAAINLSLTSLGNVIAALADNSNGKNVRVPYRDSVLTKLLMNALGGNSKTIMIAAISPADINFDETLSTLRYADRAKQIKTKPTVNEDPTEKLINDLKAENDRLKKMLAGGGGAAAAQDAGGADGGDALKRQLEENEKAMKLMQQSYEEKLASAHAQTANMERSKILEKAKTVPSLKNINMDPQLSGTIIILLEGQGVKKVGKQGKADIGLAGVGIMDEHASLTNQSGHFTLTRLNESRILVNGKPLTSSMELTHMDRLVFGTSQYYIFYDPAKASKSDPTITFESMQDEIGKASGIVSGDLNSMSREQIQCQNEVMDLLPAIEEANHISIALDKKVCFTVLPVAPEARGDYSDKVKAYVAIKNFAVGLEWVWTKEKFLDRKADMIEMYQDFQEDGNINKPKFKNYDPFAESPDTPFQIGTVMIFPKTFAYMMENHGDYKILNLRSKEAGSLNCDLVPCNEKGEQITPQQAIETFAASAQKDAEQQKAAAEAAGGAGNDQKTIKDPHAQLLGRKISFLLRINELKDLPNNYEDVYCQFSIFNDKGVYRTQTLKGDKGFKFNFSKMFSFTFNQEFLDFLMNKALFIQIWAEQKHPKIDPSSAKISTKEFFEREKLMTNRLLILGGAGLLNGGVDPEKQKLKNDLDIALANNQRNAQTIGYLHRLLQVSGPNPIPPEALARVMTAQNEQELDQVLRHVYEQAKARGGANMVPPQQVHGNQFQLPPGLMMMNPMMNQVISQHLMSNPAVVRVNYGHSNRHSMNANSQACSIL